MTTDWKTYGQALKRALWDNVTVVLHAPTLRCGWMDGGCFIAAHAVGRIVDGELWGILSKSYAMQQIEHVVVRTPDGAGFLDADGFASEQTLLRRWKKMMSHRRDLPSVSLVKLEQPGAPPWGDANVSCQVHLADELERRLRDELPKSYPGRAPRRVRTLPRVGMMLDNAEAFARGERARRARLDQARQDNPVVPPDALAQELADYLNTKVDPYDFGNFLFEQWQEQDEQWKDTTGMGIQVEDLDDYSRERFSEWLLAPEKGERISRVQQERADDPLGVPSYLYFEDAKPLGKNAWCIHFTRHEFTSFERGATLEMLGLSTHWKQKANASCKINLDDSIGLYERVFGFAFPAEVGRRYAQIWRRKYGHRAVLFQTDAAVVAYHVTDDEHQVIFPLCSERNVHDIDLDTDGTVSIDGIDESFKSLADAIKYLESQSGAASAAEHARHDNPRAIPLDDEAIWRDTQTIVQALHEHFTKVAHERGAWAASAYGSLPHNFTILPVGSRLATRTHVGKKKVDEIGLRVTVQEYPRDRSFIPTGSASLMRDGRNVVTLTVNGSHSVLALVDATKDVWGPFASQVQDVLRHEITHIADPAHGTTTPTYSATMDGSVAELAAYFNDPLELRAFMREISDQIRRRVKFSRMEADPSSVAHAVVEENRSFRAMAPHLTPSNRKLLMRAMTQVAVEETEKRNAEIRAARPIINTREKAEEAAETVRRLLEHRYRDKGGVGWIESITVEPFPEEGYRVVVRTIPGAEDKNPLTRVSQIAVVTNPAAPKKRRAS